MTTLRSLKFKDPLKPLLPKVAPSLDVLCRLTVDQIVVPIPDPQLQTPIGAADLAPVDIATSTHDPPASLNQHAPRVVQTSSSASTCIGRQVEREVIRPLEISLPRGDCGPR